VLRGISTEKVPALFRFLSRFLLTLVLLLSAVVPLPAQTVCSGDADGDGLVNESDVIALLPILFSNPAPSATVRERADANRDRALGAADIVRILQIGDLDCSEPTATPTPSPSPTDPQPSATPTISPTRTRTPFLTFTPLPTWTRTVTATSTRTTTPTVTPTPTATCTIQDLSVGTRQGDLSGSDCVRPFRAIGGQAFRRTDVYQLAATPGQAVKITVNAVGDPAIRPVIRVVDPSGQFGTAEGNSPIEFVASSAAPYEVQVASSPASPNEIGAYQLTVATRACAAAELLPIPITRNRTLDTTDCPDPGLPSIGTSVNPADVYTISVASVPANLTISMRRVGVNSDLDATFYVIGPNGYEIFDPSESDDAHPLDSEGIDAQARFLAMETGTYTIIASSNSTFLDNAGVLIGGGSYSLSVTTLSCNPTALGTLPTVSPLRVDGTLTGNALTTRCAAPLPIPFLSDDLPEINAASALYTFTGVVGETVSIGLDSDDDAHLFVYGPASAGYPFVAQDDDGGDDGGGGSQLAFTVPVAGTYLIVAANNSYLLPPDPDDPEDRTGDVISYALSVRRCGVAGGLPYETGAPLSSTFTTTDCAGFAGLPHRVYSFQGFAGQFASIEMSSPAVDSYLRLVGPDGSTIESDSDPLDGGTVNARISLLLPTSGIYYVQASRSVEQRDPFPDAPATFTLRGFSCPVSDANVGDNAGTISAGDCTAGNGRRFDVFRAGGVAAADQILSLMPPAAGCVVALLGDGTSGYLDSCSKQLVEVPISDPSRSGFVVAADNGTVAGSYVVRAATCAPLPLAYGQQVAGTLTAASCAGADGVRAARHLFRARRGLVRYADGIVGSYLPSFAASASIIDQRQPDLLRSVFFHDPVDTFRLGADDALLLKIAGATAADTGSYVVHLDQISIRR